MVRGQNRHLVDNEEDYSEVLVFRGHNRHFVEMRKTMVKFRWLGSK